jgi:hypothetical protein
MRKGFFIGVAVALVVSVPVTVMATGANHVKPAVFTGSGDLTNQAFSARINTAIFTASRAWQDVNNMSIGPICAFGAVTATVTVTVDGARAGFRVLIDGGATLAPGAAFVRGTGGGTDATTSSFTLETNASTFEGSDSHAFNVQWRSTGGATTLENGSIVVQYGDPHTCI